jgi:hypothetical protein
LSGGILALAFGLRRCGLRHTGGHALDMGRSSVKRVAVFVIDGHDIELYPDAEGAAWEIEGHDATNLDYFGADGTVYRATTGTTGETSLPTPVVVETSRAGSTAQGVTAGWRAIYL